MLSDQLLDLSNAVLKLPDSLIMELGRSRASLQADIQLMAKQLVLVDCNIQRSFAIVCNISKRLLASDAHNSFDWHIISSHGRAFRRLVSIRGWRRLQRTIHSDRGFENQFHATLFFSSHVPVVEVEGRVAGIPCDFAIRIQREVIATEVKSVDQNQKMTLLFEASSRLKQLLVDVAQLRGVNPSFTVVEFSGVVPVGVTDDQLRSVVVPFPREGEARLLHFHTGEVVSVTFGVSRESRTVLTNSLRNFETHASKVEQMGVRHSRPGPFMVAVVSSGLIRKMSAAYIERISRALHPKRTMGFVFLDVMFRESFVFSRSPVFLTKYSSPQVASLERLLPRKWEGPLSIDV